ncbi:hypothetical protein Tco_1133865 [Tanacetum coccineum]
MVTSGNSIGTKEANAGKASRDNLHDENAGDMIIGMMRMMGRHLVALLLIRKKSIRAISERFANTAYGFFLGMCVAYPVVANYVKNTWGKYGLVKSMINLSTGIFSFQFSSMEGLDAMLENRPWSSYAKALIEVRADVELKDNIVVVMPKLIGEGFCTCNVHVNYEWKPPRCACCKVFGHVQDECPKNIDSDVVKNMKKPSQPPRGVPVGPKVKFKPVKQVFRQVSKKNNVSTSSNKKKNVKPTIEVSNSNPSTRTTPIDVKIDRMERLIIDGNVTLVDDEGKPLKKVDSSGDYDSEDEVALVDNDMENFLASEKVGYGTHSLLEQWTDSYVNGDYDFDPYDDDMYEGQDIPDKIQDICDNFDIKVRDRRKK